MTIFQGDVQFTGIALLSAAAEVQIFREGDASPVGVGTLTADGDRERTGNANPTGTATLAATGVVELGAHVHMTGTAHIGPVDLRHFNLDEENAGLCDGLVATEHPPDDASIILVDQRCMHEPGWASLGGPAPPAPGVPLAGMILDLDAMTMTTDFPGTIEGTTLDTWLDQSTSLNHGTLPSPPGFFGTYRAAGLNGHPSMDFASGEVLQLANPINEDAFTIIMM
jgi:hypothetical protein